MKNILFAFVALFLLTATTNSEAQRVVIFKNSTGVAADTVLNTASKSLSSVRTDPYFNTVAVQVDITKVSGTVAGSLYLQGSLDGTNYFNVDTLTATDVATQAKLFLLDSYPYAYLRVNYTGVGTMKAYFKTQGLYKKP